MIYIVSGPSCAGKSTFLQSANITTITNLSSTCPVVFPATMPNNIDALKAGCFFHYNIMRVADHSYRNPDKSIQSLYDFISDPQWLELRKFSVAKKAIVLIASRSTLVKRMSLKGHVEPRNLTGCSPVQYPIRHWLEVLNTVDLYGLYLAWCAELKKLGIACTLLNSENRDYEIIRQDQLRDLF